MSGLRSKSCHPGLANQQHDWPDQSSSNQSLSVWIRLHVVVLLSCLQTDRGHPAADNRVRRCDGEPVAAVYDRRNPARINGQRPILDLTKIKARPLLAKQPMSKRRTERAER